MSNFLGIASTALSLINIGGDAVETFHTNPQIRKDIREMQEMQETEEEAYYKAEIERLKKEERLKK